MRDQSAFGWLGAVVEGLVVPAGFDEGLEALDAPVGSDSSGDELVVDTVCASSADALDLSTMSMASVDKLPRVVCAGTLSSCGRGLRMLTGIRFGSLMVERLLAQYISLKDASGSNSAISLT
jgi:hypothetical protein